jgi:tetratricopeptide (TPR) repeat protein
MFEVSFSIWIILHAAVVIIIGGGIFSMWFLPRINSRNVKKTNASGVKMLRAGRWEQAILFFKNAVSLNPHDAISHWNLGFALYLGKDDWKEAFKEFNNAIRLNPTIAGPYYGRGKIYLNHLNQKELASEDFSTALKINPKIEKTFLALRNIKNADIHEVRDEVKERVSKSRILVGSTTS